VRLATRVPGFELDVTRLEPARQAMARLLEEGQVSGQGIVEPARR
jgi:hypothetical protein